MKRRDIIRLIERYLRMYPCTTTWDFLAVLMKHQDREKELLDLKLTTMTEVQLDAHMQEVFADGK